jgi:hypothetical protein
MKRSPTGIFVIALLTLITINHIYKPSIRKYADADTMVEGFGVLNGTLTDSNDVSYTEMNSITLDINEVVQTDNQTNYDYLKAQILNTVRMFNAKLELYIKTYIDNPEISDPTILNRKNTINKHAITFLISILPQLFGNLNEFASDYIYGFASTYSFIPMFNGIIKQDNTVTPKMLKTIRMYFNRMNSYVQVVLYQLLQKTESASNQNADSLYTLNQNADSLYTLNQLTNTENTSEPSIIHFLIKTDDNSELVKFLNQLSKGTTPAIMALDFYISNSINYVVNDNFTLIIKIYLLTPDYKSTYELRKITDTNPKDTIDKHIEDMQYETKKKNKQLTEGDVLSGLNPSSAYTSLIGKIMICIILGMVALVLGIYYYIMSQGTQASASSENPRKITSDMMTYMNLPNMAYSMKNAISGIKMPKLPGMPNIPGIPGISGISGIPGMAYLSDNPITVLMAILLFVFLILYMTLGGKDKNSDYLSWGNVDIKAKTKELKESSKNLYGTYLEYSDVINENTNQKKEKIGLDKNKNLYDTAFVE